MGRQYCDRHGTWAGNAQTEFTMLALNSYRKDKGNFIKLLELINKYFKPMQKLWLGN